MSERNTSLLMDFERNWKTVSVKPIGASCGHLVCDVQCLSVKQFHNVVQTIGTIINMKICSVPHGIEERLEQSPYGLAAPML